MAGGSNYSRTAASNKPTSSSSSHRSSRWQSENNKAPADRNLPAAGTPRRLPPPPPPKSKPSLNNPPPKPNPNQQKPIPDPSPSGAPFPYPNNHPPPPSYGFHMLDRRSIGLADGSVRSYFALPQDYQDFAPKLPPRVLGHEMNGVGLGLDHQFPMSPEFRDPRNEYWNSLGQKDSLKRKFVDDGEQGRRDEREERDGLARQRQQLLQYGNAGLNPGTSRRDEEMRVAKYTRGEHGEHNMRGEHGEPNTGRNKYSEVDQVALKKAFLQFVKLVNENVDLRKSYLGDGKQGRVRCVACSRSSKEFPDMHGLIMHTYNPDSAELLVEHLGLHKALCILMGWNYHVSPDNSKKYQILSADEAAANQDDLIMWPPHVIIQNTMTGKGREGRMEGLGNRAMETKLRDFGFSSGKSKSLYGKEGHLGVTLVKFVGDQSGLKEALRLEKFFERENHGRRSWADLQNLVSSKSAENNPNLVRVDKSTGEKEKILYGYLATASDFDTIDLETKKKVLVVSKREYKPNE